MGYLDQYGVVESRRERILKRALLLLIATAAVVGGLYYGFKNYPQERRAREFLAVIERGDYPAAYDYWGCKVETPCPNYDYQSFLEDWGPSSKIGKVRSFRLADSTARGSGVVVSVVVNSQPEIRLWVEKRNGVVGFSPF